jgi:hypothetical protein
VNNKMEKLNVRRYKTYIFERESLVNSMYRTCRSSINPTPVILNSFVIGLYVKQTSVEIDVGLIHVYLKI